MAGSSILCKFVGVFCRLGSALLLPWLLFALLLLLLLSPRKRGIDKDCFKASLFPVRLRRPLFWTSE